MNIDGKPYRTIWMEGEVAKLIYQPALPHHFEIRTINDPETMAEAIREMWIRGAPAIGAAGAYGMVLAINRRSAESYKDEIRPYVDLLNNTRPTAQNLFVGTESVLNAILAEDTYDQAKTAALKAAEAMVQQDIQACERIGELGAELLKEGDRVLTHCNAGWLACVDWGTAISPMYKANRAGKKVSVFVDETKPRGQGARLTAYELGQEGIEHAIIADNAAGYFMSKGEVQCVIVEQTELRRTGMWPTRIGTYTKALAAQANGIPFYVAVPMTTIDFACSKRSGDPHRRTQPREVLYTWGRNDSGEFVACAPLRKAAPPEIRRSMSLLLRMLLESSPKKGCQT